jgi:hypothetical protein
MIVDCRAQSPDTYNDNTVPEGTTQHVYAMYEEPETSQE